MHLSLSDLILLFVHDFLPAMDPTSFERYRAALAILWDHFIKHKYIRCFAISCRGSIAILNNFLVLVESCDRAWVVQYSKIHHRGGRNIALVSDIICEFCGKSLLLDSNID